ncbi:hypothetical protein XELAEV_18024125mg [Xenopus laevis]|uniref:Uncharacterized protein n=1 Tax=Xenopus laevis TaxID=8355 RepID=A0A974D686_XENLA|nr:hypothetical protein XELAEV_18024125mg [Xenopus laevis]
MVAWGYGYEYRCVCVSWAGLGKSEESRQYRQDIVMRPTLVCGRCSNISADLFSNKSAKLQLFFCRGIRAISPCHHR